MLAQSAFFKNFSSPCSLDNGSRFSMIPASFLRTVTTVQQFADLPCGNGQTFSEPLFVPSLHHPGHPLGMRVPRQETVLSPLRLRSVLRWQRFAVKTRSAAKRTGRLEVLHIIVLDENRNCSHDRLEWQKHIGRFLGDIDGYPCRNICSSPTRFFGGFGLIDASISGTLRRRTDS